MGIKLTPFVKQCIVTGAVGCNIICNIGFVFGLPGVLLPALQQPHSEIPLSKLSASWIASIISITSLLGNFVTPSIMERFGRRVAHICASMPAVISWFVLAFATDVQMVLFARVLQGLSAGAILPLRSVLIGEYASPKYRGGFLTSVSLAQGFGIFLIHFIGSVLNWKTTSIVCGIIAISSLIMAFYLPESPSWLALKGKYEECRKAFRLLRGDEEERELEELIESQIKLKKKKEREENGPQVNCVKKLGAVVKRREFYMPLIIVFHCLLMLQACGNSTLPAFSVQVITLMMGPTANAHAWMVVLDSLRLGVNIAAVFIINKFKRRTVLFSTGGLCTFAHVAIAVYMYCKSNNLLSYDAEWIPGLLIVLQFFCIGLGMVPMPTVISGELIPLEFRSVISSIGVIFLSSVMFLVLQTFPLLLDSIHLSGTYAIYAAVLSYLFIVLWFILPETSGKTLQEIENELRGEETRIQDVEARVSLKQDESETARSLT
ncbi:PREDICTED: facilitated trehalose transporter Tret1-like [Papilio polytes]|uniref:facilitated trehalose transporter Tret1-like n=1 Tax=Papilio polytes TaxID=76194 RepID=UPI0006766BC8|nr:PREDICTED: facilitated trehalose transporter Tret1-like [Papilio polytes]